MKNIKPLPLLIRADGTKETLLPKNGKTFTLEELQKAVGGRIEIFEARDRRSLICYEESKLDGQPINEAATKLWKYGSLNPGDWALHTHDFIAGDVLVAHLSWMND